MREGSKPVRAVTVTPGTGRKPESLTGRSTGTPAVLGHHAALIGNQKFGQIEWVVKVAYLGCAFAVAFVAANALTMTNSSPFLPIRSG